MALDNRTLEILIKTLADTGGIDETRDKLSDLGEEAKSAGAGVSQLGTLIGAGLGVAAVFAVNKLVDEIVRFRLEQAKFNQEIANQEIALRRAIEQWDRMASSARDFGDQAKLADAIKRQLDRMALDMAEFRSVQIPLWQKFGDEVAARFGKSWTETLARIALAIPSFGASLYLGGGGGPKPYQSEADRQRQEAQDQYLRGIRDANIELDKAAEETARWARAQADLPAGIQEYTNEVGKLDAKLKELDVERHLRPEDRSILDQYGKTARDLDVANDRLRQLNREQDQLNRKLGAAGEAGLRQEISALMREQATLMQNIHQQEQLIQENPLLGINEKNVALLDLYAQKAIALQAMIADLEAQKQRGVLDPLQIEQVNQKLQQTRFELQFLGLQTTRIQKSFQVSMVDWANSFGSVGDQVGKSLQSSIGASLQSLNQYLITGKGSAEQLVQQLANIGLQLIENLAIQQIMQAFAKTSQAQRQASATSELAVQAPLAAATSVSSFGTAAIAATVALGVIAAIIAALTLHTGGQIGRRGRIRRMHAGGLAPDEVPIIAQEGEIMINRDVAQQPGMTEFLLGINAGRFHGGGVMERGGGFPSGFTQFWPGGGRYEGPNQVAAGPGILGGRSWQDFEWHNYLAGNVPFVGLEGPRGTLGQWVTLPGGLIGRVIDVKQKGYTGFGILRRGQYDNKGNWIGPGKGAPPSGGFTRGGSGLGSFEFPEFGGIGTMPLFGGSISGPTMIPTSWTNRNTGSPFIYAPRALPVGRDIAGGGGGGSGYGDQGGGAGLGTFYVPGGHTFMSGALGPYTAGSPGTGDWVKAFYGIHTGGRVGRSGVSLRGNFNVPRFHSGGSVSGGIGGGDIAIFSFTDQKQLAKAVSRSSANRKVIFDTITGRRIDLGL